jgi:hypothetical protein
VSARDRFRLRSAASSALVWTLLCVPLLAETQSADSVCPKELYGGFDSRLDTVLTAALEAPERDVVEFVVRNGRPIILASRRLFVDGGTTGWAAMPIIERTHGLVLHASGAVELPLGEHGWIFDAEGRREREGTYDSALVTRLGKRASPAALELIDLGGERYTMEAVSLAGKRMSVAYLKSKPSAIGWNAAGLSFVADSTLWVWQVEERELRPLISDVGLKEARSTCLLSDGRVIAGLANVTVVASEGYALPLVGFGSFCDVDGHDTTLLDPGAGAVWRVERIGDVGNRTVDTAYAARLVSGTANEGAPQTVRLSEAVRMIGCPAVTKLREARQ